MQPVRQGGSLARISLQKVHIYIYIRARSSPYILYSQGFCLIWAAMLFSRTTTILTSLSMLPSEQVSFHRSFSLVNSCLGRHIRPRTLERARTRIIRVDDETLGPIPISEQHLLFTNGRSDQLYQWTDRCQGMSPVVSAKCCDGLCTPF